MPSIIHSVPFLVLLAGVSAQVRHCNETVDSIPTDDPVLSRSLVGSEASQQGQPLYCWFKFQATDNQIVQIDVKSIKAGAYNEAAKSCEEGFLRISDEQVCSTDPEWLPPTTLCGTYEQGRIRVKRYTQGPSAFVEFKVDEVGGSNGYDFDVTFLDKDSENHTQEPQTELHYGNANRKEGRIRNTKCDWLIPVNLCSTGYCHVVSPLYPGIYPSNTRCRYQFTHFNNGRVELIFSGNRYSGKFDLKADDECADDFIEIHDGSSTADPVIGRWCGQDGANIISSGPSLLMIFQTGPGGPPWDYSGFDIQYVDRWTHEHEGGLKVEGTLCDWDFDSSKLEEDEEPLAREFHTPDHQLPENTKCSFYLYGRPHEYVVIEINVFESEDSCKESLDIYDGEKHLGRVCPSAKRKRGGKKKFPFTTSGPDAKVVFTTADGHVSATDPTWIYYTFTPNPEYNYTANAIAGGNNPQEVRDGQNKGSGFVTSSIVLLTSLLLALKC